MKILDLLAKPGVGISLLWLKTMTIVLVVIFYWVYDSTLLAAYGIGPEMNVRGVFESKLVITWLSVHALKPLVWVLVAIFVTLTIAGVAHDILKKRRYRKVQWSFLTTKSERRRQENPFEHGIWVVMSIFLVLLGASLIIPFLDTKAREQVQRQIERFLEKEECTDLFSNDSIGCYTISGQEGEGHLLIFQGRNALAYMSREPANEDGEQTEAKVVVVYKDGRQIVREYQRSREASDLSESKETDD